MSSHMLKNPTSLAVIALAAAGCMTDPHSIASSSNEAVSYDGSVEVGAHGDVSVASWQYAMALRPQMGLSEQDDFYVKSATVGLDGRHHVRLQQTHQDLAVWGADVVVHATDVEVTSLSGNVVAGLSDVDTAASIASSHALSIAMADYTVAAGGAEGLFFEREHTDLVLLPLDEGGVALAWHVEFYTELQAGMEPGLWNTFVDAQSGEVIAMYNALHTFDQASGPGGNPKVERFWDEALDVVPSGSEYAMDTPLLRTTDMNNSTWGGGSVVTGPLDHIGSAAINDAHGFAEITLDMLDAWMGMNSIDDAGFPIRSRVHYGRNYENAFWNGSQMTYGDGDQRFYPLSGDLHVVSHEIHHGFTSFHSNLIYRNQSGGLNESFSDIAAVVADYFHDSESAGFNIGEDVFQEEGGALRYMCDPTRDGRSIDHADDYQRGMTVHFSSGISNKAFCLAARRLSSGDPDGEASRDGVRRAGTAWFEANRSYWVRGSSFTQGCQGVIDAAVALDYEPEEIDAIHMSWEDVGVFCDTGALETRGVSE